MPDMDLIIERELKGLILDEEKIYKKTGSFIGLIHHIFPLYTLPTGVELNKSYRQVLQCGPGRNNVHKKLPVVAGQSGAPTALTRQVAKGNQSAPSSKKKALLAPKSKWGRTVPLGKEIYNLKKKSWKWEEVDLMEIDENIHAIVDSHFSHSGTPQALYLGTLVNSRVLDGVLTGSQAPVDQPQQSGPRADTDTEDDGGGNPVTSSLGGSSGFLDEWPRHGAAYDGDDSQDLAYGAVKKGTKKTTENQFSVFLNLVSASVLHHLKDINPGITQSSCVTIVPLEGSTLLPIV
ncbi:hypothetical protein HYDPIDRAFT_31934 [Hydnomerulius pinastri MD-312]|uniref:Uncharacterized protein n=1 Tax=Hydnomerulius pinastri MD-312 TaxID=994086 RepID=A0A0C9W3H4_9AGAM|nr:hypothetical protein HYDPIDRAFT_31934 [Hydnomerulius pinastri MD-312]